MISSAMDGPWRSHYSYIFYVQVNLPRVQRSRAIMPNNDCPSTQCRMQMPGAVVRNITESHSFVQGAISGVAAD